MISIADIPFKMFNFRGTICVLLIDNKEYKFTTYNNTKILKYEVSDNSLNISLKKGEFHLRVESKLNKGQKLTAPVKGKMSKDIYESITSFVTVTLMRKNTIIFSDTSSNCGLEIVDDINL